ncbi:hypothetical protein ABH926_005877 [Catenulispora sp. GP43]|uniref:DUF2255 family protein n=1 Tax=Catenulispora sp. GP43 TaxID=3156263 RepID=UPI00351130B7
MMADTAWSTGELEQIASRDELDVAPRRNDGTLTKPRIVWMVRVGGDVYIRSVQGTEGAWYRTTRGRGEGHVNTGTVDKDVTFLDVEDSDGLQDRIDAAYRAKYSRYPGPVASITAAKARATTMRLVPR